MNRWVFAAVIALIVGGAWSVGRAQARVATFEIAIETPRGPVTVTCDNGCNWPANEGVLVCDSEQCRWRFTGHGRVFVGQPVTPRP